MIQIHEIIKKQLAIAGAEEDARTSENGKAGVGEGTVGCQVLLPYADLHFLWVRSVLRTQRHRYRPKAGLRHVAKSTILSHGLLGGHPVLSLQDQGYNAVQSLLCCSGL